MTMRHVTWSVTGQKGHSFLTSMRIVNTYCYRGFLLLFQLVLFSIVAHAERALEIELRFARDQTTRHTHLSGPGRGLAPQR